MTSLIDLSTLLLSGHDTTASGETWFLSEVAQHPDAQECIRREVVAMRARSNREEYTAAGLDGMQYTRAILKIMDNQTSVHPPQ